MTDNPKIITNTKLFKMPNTEIKGNCRKDMSDLALSQTYVPDVPKDIIFPDELNAYLRDQLQYLTHENGMLKKNLTETERKLQEQDTRMQTLSKQLKQYEEAVPSNTFSTVSNIASSKIVDLSKKLREKASELESLRTKCSKLEHQLYLFQQKEAETKEQFLTDNKPSKPTQEFEDDIKQLQDKLTSITSKLFDTKNANVQLKHDLKLANKFLQLEVGDNFETLQCISNNGSNWRGRTQIICDLQQKNSELREKLRQLQDKKSDTKLTTDPVVPLKYDRRLDILSKENITLKTDSQELKKRLDGSRARAKALESENAVSKAKLSMLSEQQEKDRDLIATLTGQLSAIKNVQSDDVKYKDQMIMKLQRECKNLNTEFSKEQCKYENLKQEMDRKLAQQTPRKDHYNHRMDPSTIYTDDKIVHRLDAERIRLLELTEMTNKRLESEKKSLAELQMQYKFERQKNAKLEGKIARLELDSGRNSTYTLSTSRSAIKEKDKEEDSVFKDKLELAEENIKALQTRLEMERKEREMDFQEFSQILRNYTPVSSDKSLI